MAILICHVITTTTPAEGEALKLAFLLLFKLTEQHWGLFGSNQTSYTLLLLRYVGTVETPAKRTAVIRGLLCLNLL
jgi:hypothetical protein